jgi:hypothetical protein
LGFNARVGKRFVWGINNTAGTTWFQSNSNGSQGRDVTGAVNLYTIYMWKPWLTLQTGVDLSSIFKDTGSNGSDPAPADTSNMSLGTTLKLSNRFDMTLGLQLQGGFSSFSSNSNSGSNSNLLSGSVGFVYKVSRENTLNLGLSSAIIQDDTAKIQPGSENTSNGYGITQQRSVSMDLGYKMRIGKATCNLGVNYTSAGNVSGSTGGDSGSNSSGDYTFSAGLSYPVWGKRASLGLTYSFEYAPATTSNGSSSSFQDESNTSQNLIANMAYAF